MKVPGFSAQASLYASSNQYRSSPAADGSALPQSVVAAYIPGPQTQHDCSVCTDACAVPRDVCLAKVAVTVAEACVASLFFGCGAAVALGYIQTASCYSAYEACLGYCNIPGGLGPFSGPCCPKVCGPPNPLEGSGTGCCDHGEVCVGEDSPNSRDGCCPVGRFCGGNTCCSPDHTCVEGVCVGFAPFGNGSPPPPPPINNCIFGGEPCGRKCCFGGFECCNDPGGPTCRQGPCLR